MPNQPKLLRSGQSPGVGEVNNQFQPQLQTLEQTLALTRNHQRGTAMTQELPSARALVGHSLAKAVASLTAPLSNRQPNQL